MNENRIDIEVVDKVSPTVKTKFLEIASGARQADAALRQLKKALSEIGSGGIDRLATAQAKLATSTLKLHEASAKTALAQQKLSTETARTAAQTAKATVETNKSATAAAKASTAQLNLATAYYKSESALNKAVSAEKQAAIAQERLKAATVKTSTAQSQAAAASSRAEQATLRLKAAQDRAAASANKSSFNFSAMKGKIVGVVAALGTLWAALKVADDFANLENRLRSTGLEGDALNSVMQKLQESANNTRSSLTGTVELYSRLAVSSSELGVTQEQLIGFTTSLNQAILLSGANAAEAQAGLIQLAQGMASGKLQGDELKSILEQLPEVAKVIAKSMGVTRGELRQLGADGKISAQTILKAFREAGPELETRFASLEVTAGQALTVLKNNIMALAGTEGKGVLEQVTGIITDLTKALVELGENGSLGLFTGLLESTAKIIRVIVLGLQAFFIGVVPMIFSGLGQLMTGFNQTLTGWVSTIVDVVSYVLPDAWGNGLKDMIGGLEKFNDNSLKWFQEIETNAVGSLDRIGSTMAEIYAYKPPEAGTDQKAIDKYKAEAEARRKLAEAANTELHAKKKLAEQNREISAARDAVNVPEANYSYSEITKQIDEMFAALEMTDRQLAIHNSLQEYAAKIPQDSGSADMLKVFEKQLNMYYDQKAISDELNKIYEDTQGQLESVATKQTALNLAFDQGLLSAGAYTSQMLALDAQAAQLRMTMGDGTWADVFNNSLYSMVSAYQGVLPEMQSAFGSFFTSISDGFADSVGRAIVYSEDLGTALENVAKGAIADFISAMVKMGIQTAITSTMQTSVTTAALTTQTAASVAAATATAGAWAPAATMASLASFGANAAPASAGLLSTSALAQSLAAVPGFEVGGYTGNAGRSDVAGVVHGQEYVFDAASVQRIGVDNLEAMRSGKGSPQQASGGGGNTYVYNYNDQVQGGSQAERESRFTQFKRATAATTSDRASKRAQVAL